jgi:hypothetical protein
MPHNRRPLSSFVASVAAVALLLLAGCELRSKPAPITVYSPTLAVSFPLPQGWTSDAAVEQAGFHMQTFTGRSVDVPGRPGIRVQVLGGPMPDGTVDDVAVRFRKELDVESEAPYSLAGDAGRGKIWAFVSKDGDERSRLALADVEGTLYGLFVRGEAGTVDSYNDALDRMFREFSLETARYFTVFEAPGGDVVIRHPRSWERTQTIADPGKSLFVAFRSPPLAVERDGTTVHATLEVTVNQVGADMTVERFYDERTQQLGDTYRLLDHKSLDADNAVSALYHVETQLAEYLERTVYAVRDRKSFIFKFNCRNQVYRAIEPWIDEMVKSFFEPT